MNGSDGFMSPGTSAFRQAGTGLAVSRNCLVGDHNVIQTAGGAYVRYRGISCWACNPCVERLAAKRADKTAA